jgi:hypothetical protein
LPEWHAKTTLYFSHTMASRALLGVLLCVLCTGVRAQTSFTAEPWFDESFTGVCFTVGRLLRAEHPIGASRHEAHHGTNNIHVSMLRIF